MQDYLSNNFSTIVVGTTCLISGVIIGVFVARMSKNPNYNANSDDVASIIKENEILENKVTFLQDTLNKRFTQDLSDLTNSITVLAQQFSQTLLSKLLEISTYLITRSQEFKETFSNKNQIPDNYYATGDDNFYSVLENYDSLLFIKIFILIGIIIIADIVIYFMLYKLRKIETTVQSWFWFSCNFLTFVFFIFSITFILPKLKNPIYLENLSTYSFYRYSFLLIGISFLGFCYFSIMLFSPRILKSKFFSFLTFPHMKEEIKKILETYYHSFFDAIFDKLDEYLFKGTKNVYIYCTFHFICLQLISVFQSFLLLNFAIFHGDLRWNLYILPISFIIWITKNIEYYYRQQFRECIEYLQKILYVTLKEGVFLKKKYGLSLATLDDLDFTITVFGEAEGFSNDSVRLKIMKKMWIDHINVVCILDLYTKNILFYINILVLFIRLFSWNIIVFSCLFKYNSEMLLGVFDIISRSIQRTSAAVSRRSYVSAAYRIKNKEQKNLEKETEGSYKSGHLAKMDTDIRDDQGRVRYEGCVTHGEGSFTNPSYVENKTQDLKGPHPKGQSTVPPKQPIFVDENTYIKEKVPNSEQFYKDTESRSNTAKNTYKNWEDDNT
jgi:hypothetical protein